MGFNAIYLILSWVVGAFPARGKPFTKVLAVFILLKLYPFSVH